MSRRIVIVGGVAGGATAAARVRRLDESAEITIFERSGFVSYANCGLPYYIGGVIGDRDALTLQTPESFRARFAVDVRVRHEVTAIHPERKTVSVRDLEAGREFEEPYDALLLAPGARPAVPPLPGVGGERLFTLRTVEDALKIRGYIDGHGPRSAVLAGGGFIGVELAENLRGAGLEVSIVDMRPQLMNQLDADMAAFVHAKLRAEGVRLLLGRSVAGFEETEGGLRTLLDGGEALEADMAVLALGVVPETALAKAAGLELGPRGAIVVDERMRTSIPDIYAVGDAVQVRDLVTGDGALVPLAGPANRQARVAADNICGLESRFGGVQGSSVVKVFDMTVASTGLSEKAARAAGIDCDKVFLSPASHAGYYPGGTIMTMKVLFEKGGFRLLGAQIVGHDGVDKRIDVLATALRAGMTVPQLRDLELAYAPPYSSAKDPVNMAGFIADNLARGVVGQLHWHDVAALPRDGSVTLLDVRTEKEYAAGHVDGFVNIPVDELRARLDELPAGRPLVVMCQSALRSYIACRILTQRGFACRNLAGGYRLWKTVTREFGEEARGADCAARTAAPCGKE